MTEHNDLLESIANTIKGYREGEIEEPSAQHVNRWVNQFDNDVQISLLREIDHVFKTTYFSKENASIFFARQILHKKIAGDDACVYWEGVNFLNIQQHGHSQVEILELFAEGLKEQCNIEIKDCGSVGGDFLYLDDVIFSGSRVKNDLEQWIENDAPANAVVHVIVAALHTGGEYFLEQRISKKIKDSGKNIVVHYWRAINVENRKYHKYNSEVLWPCEIPDDPLVHAYMEKPHRYPFEPRREGGELGPFSSEQGRQLLEREFLTAGVKILSRSENPKEIIRPLGFSLFGIGFGSMIVTYRNCPNNTPLALWWGDPNATSGPLHWYPLLPRKTYAQSIDFSVIEL